jgi:hypothetical protein
MLCFRVTSLDKQESGQLRRRPGTRQQLPRAALAV